MSASRVPRGQFRLIYRSPVAQQKWKHHSPCEVWLEYVIGAMSVGAPLQRCTSADGVVLTDLQVLKRKYRRCKGKVVQINERSLKLTPRSGQIKGARADLRVGLPSDAGWGKKPTVARLFAWYSRVADGGKPFFPKAALATSAFQ